MSSKTRLKSGADTVAIKGWPHFATLSFVPVYGLQNGLELPIAALTLTVLIVGNVALQFPIGWMVDHFSKRSVMLACSLMTVIFACLLPPVMGTLWMWPVLVALGANAYGIYTVSLAELGDRFHGHDLVTGASAFALMWGVGALLGAVSAGWAMKKFGPHGLPLFLAACYAALFLSILLRKAHPARHG